MNASRFAIGLVVLALTGLWYFAGGAQPIPAPTGADAPQLVAAPLTHENLSVYFIHGGDAVPDAKVLTLKEALDRNLAVVHETSNVNVLTVENRATDAELFIQSEDLVKGGKQDRMAATDLLLPPRSGVVALAVHCVEQGRWTGRGSEDAGRFASSNQCAAGKDVKYANRTFNQSGSWTGSKSFQAKLSASLGVPMTADASPSSLQLTLELPALQARVAGFEAALKGAGEDRDDIIGVVFVVNGQVTGADVYGSNALFRKAWPKLLSAAAVEAIAEHTNTCTAALPSTREVERYLVYGAAKESAASESGSPGQGGSAQPSSPYLNLVRSQQRAGGYYGHVIPLAVNANEEIVQTEGRAPQTVGRATGYSFSAHAAAPPAEPSMYLPVAPVRFSPDGARNVTGSSATMEADRATTDTAHVWTAVPPAPPTSADGNRLNSNRVENSATLMVESVDATRKNAVIHRSYLTAPTTGGDNGRVRAAAQPALPAMPAVQTVR